MILGWSHRSSAEGSWEELFLGWSKSREVSHFSLEKGRKSNLFLPQTTLHSVTTQKISTWIFTTMKTLNLTSVNRCLLWHNIMDWNGLDWIQLVQEKVYLLTVINTSLQNFTSIQCKGWLHCSSLWPQNSRYNTMNYTTMMK